jgi:hypothetical protein
MPKPGAQLLAKNFSRNFDLFRVFLLNIFSNKVSLVRNNIQKVGFAKKFFQKIFIFLKRHYPKIKGL